MTTLCSSNSRDEERGARFRELISKLGLGFTALIRARVRGLGADGLGVEESRAVLLCVCVYIVGLVKGARGYARIKCASI